MGPSLTTTSSSLPVRLDLREIATAYIAPASQDRPKIEPLTTVRFVAAFWVVLLHTVGAVWPTTTDTFTGRFIADGYLAVGFFFMLSGYILAVVYLRSGKALNKGQFLQARFARIYPVFVFTLLLDLPHLVLDRMTQHSLRSASIISAGRVLANLFMLQAWYPRFRGIDGPNWSLSVETFFYLLFPWIGLWVWRLTGTKLFAWAGAVFAFSMLAIAFLMNLRIEGDALRYNPVSNLGIFVLGILLAKIQVDYCRTSVAQGRLKALAPFLAAAGVGAVVTCIQFSNNIPSQLLSHGLLTPAFACLLLALSSRQKTLTHLLSFKWMVVLGEASYALYLLHVPLWHIVEMLRIQMNPLRYVLFLATLVGLSILSFFYFETPARKFILDWFSSHRRRTLMAGVTVHE